MYGVMEYIVHDGLGRDVTLVVVVVVLPAGASAALLLLLLLAKVEMKEIRVPACLP